MAKFNLRRERLNSQGYDRTGCYWGIGQPLYAFNDDWQISDYIRAPNREEAKRLIRIKYPDATFYN